MDYISQIARLPKNEQAELLQLLKDLESTSKVDGAREKFLSFVQYMWPGFIYGRHHKIIAELFDDVLSKKENRIIINMPPRHTKSEFASIYLPAFFLGKYPDKKIIQTSHTADLALGFGRKVRNMIDSPDFQRLFPNVSLAADSKAAGRWATNRGGEYFAIGVGGAVAGKGADLFVIDDPVSEQEGILAEGNPEVYNKVLEWYETGPRQRLQPDAAIIVVMCVAEGQRVLMANGSWKPIEEISVGDLVTGYEDGKPVYKTVTKVMPQGPDEIIKVVSRSTELRVNRRHPVLVVRGGLKKSAQTQDDVRASRNWETEWVQAGDLVVGDTIVTIKRIADGGHRPMQFNSRNQMSRDDYWFWGFMFGDGWIVSSEGRGDVGLAIAKSDKPDLNDEVLTIAERKFGRRPSDTQYGYYRIDHKAAAEWMRERGFSSGAKVKRLPVWVYRLRACDKRQFLRGFLAADGWLRPSKGVETFSACVANYELLDDLRLLARTCGVKTSKIYQYDFTAQPPNSPMPVEAVNYSARFSFRQDKIELRGRYRYQGDLGRYFRLEDVEAILPDGVSNVYDITVDGAESFIAEGIVVHNTRWSLRDLTGQLIKKQLTLKDGEYGDRWKVVELPALLPSGKPIWPEYWKEEQLLATKASIPVARWNSQYQQQPTAEEGALIKRDYWQDWEGPRPKFETIIQSWDTAYTKGTRADYSACTTWGVFKHPTLGRNCLMLIDAIRGKWEFPELKKQALDHYRVHRPDICLIEARSSGMPLIYEFRMMGIPVQDVVVGRGATKGSGNGPSNDKISRVNSTTDVFFSKNVYAPKVHAFAQEVIEECASFPAGEHDDYVDTVVMAVTRFRQGGWVGSEKDFEDEDDFAPPSYEYY
jgi:predicted phage terminase large subunit-like protein